MDYSLSQGHCGTRPRIPDHVEAEEPVGPAVDRVIPFGTSFAMLASNCHASRPMGGGQVVCTLVQPIIVESPNGLLLVWKSLDVLLGVTTELGFA